MIKILKRIVGSEPYWMAVMFIAMPMNGSLIERGQVGLGCTLIALQIPWALCKILKIYEPKE